MAERVNVTFSDPIYAALKKLAEDKGVSMADVLREAIGREKWFEETRKSGGRILVERDGTIREVIDTSVR